MDSALSLLASVAVDELAEKRPPRSTRQQPVPKAHAAAAPAANGVPAVLPATAAIATPPEQELAAMVSSLLAKQLHAMRSMVKQATTGPPCTTSSSSEGPSVMVPVGCMLDLLDLVLRCSGLIAGGPEGTWTQLLLLKQLVQLLVSCPYNPASPSSPGAASTSSQATAAAAGGGGGGLPGQVDPWLVQQQLLQQQPPLVAGTGRPLVLPGVLGPADAAAKLEHLANATLQLVRQQEVLTQQLKKHLVDQQQQQQPAAAARQAAAGGAAQVSPGTPTAFPWGLLQPGALQQQQQATAGWAAGMLPALLTPQQVAADPLLAAAAAQGALPELLQALLKQQVVAQLAAQKGLAYLNPQQQQQGSHGSHSGAVTQDTHMQRQDVSMQDAQEQAAARKLKQEQQQKVQPEVASSSGAVAGSGGSPPRHPHTRTGNGKPSLPSPQPPMPAGAAAAALGPKEASGSLSSASQSAVLPPWLGSATAAAAAAAHGAPASGEAGSGKVAAGASTAAAGGPDVGAAAGGSNSSSMALDNMPAAVAAAMAAAAAAAGRDPQAAAAGMAAAVAAAAQQGPAALSAAVQAQGVPGLLAAGGGTLPGVLGAGAGGQPHAAAAVAAINALLSGNGSATGSEVYQLLAAAQAAGLAPSGSVQAAAGGGAGGVSPPPGTWRHLMTPGERAEKLQRYRTKKQARNFDKVRYQSRQRASVSRPRQHGRFAAGREGAGEDEDYMSEDEEVQGGNKDSQQP